MIDLYIIGELGEECIGRLDDLSTIANVPFRASTILVGVAVLIALLAICAMLMFFFCQSTTVFYMCAWMQVVSGSYPVMHRQKRKKSIVISTFSRRERPSGTRASASILESAMPARPVLATHYCNLHSNSLSARCNCKLHRYTTPSPIRGAGK